jgi:hypothetical protein
VRSTKKLENPIQSKEVNSIMAITKGLKAIQERQDERQSGPRWFKMPDGGSWRVRFLDDLDESSDTTLNGAGIAVMVEEHTSPKDFRRKALCTKDEEGRCWACEQAISKPRTGWGKRGRVYMNVLANDGREEPYIAVFSMGINRSPVFETLKETFIDDGSIANREFRMKRSGEGTNTTYILRDLGIDAEPFAFNDYERFDTETIVRHVGYDAQESFYIGDNTAAAPEEEGGEW